MSDSATYPLRLPRSVKAAAERIAKEEGVSMNQFVATAVAEKLAALRTETYFAARSDRADPDALRRLLERPDGEPPRAGDER